MCRNLGRLNLRHIVRCRRADGGPLCRCGGLRCAGAGRGAAGLD